MAQVIEIHLESYYKLARRSLVFRFMGRDFKLLRGRKRKGLRFGSKLVRVGTERDCLLTIIRDHDQHEWNEAVRVALIYLGCVSWENRALIGYRPGGGHGFKDEWRTEIRKAFRANVTERRLPAITHYLRVEHLPCPQSPEHLAAIGLYREGMESESPFYKVLCFWNILSVTGRGTSAIEGWIDAAVKHRRSRLILDGERELVASTPRIGYYLADSCRNAIAHIRRNKPLDPAIDPNSPSDHQRMAIAARLLEGLARVYVEEDLGMKETLSLYRFGARAVPEYLTYAEMCARNRQLRRRVRRVDAPMEPALRRLLAERRKRLRAAGRV
jgi:hypothetical protein